MSVGRVFLTILKLFLLTVVTAYIPFLMPELRYDFGPKEPVKIESVEDLSLERFPEATFASVKGKADFDRAATFAKHGVRFTYFLLNEYDKKIVVRTSEKVDESWGQIDFHIGRLRPYRRMPFRRSVRAGFRQHFDIGIPEDAFFLARDDVPKPNGWSVGAVIFAGVLWVVLFYFFFVHRLIFRRRGKVQLSGNSAATHHAEPEPSGDEPCDDGSNADKGA